MDPRLAMLVLHQEHNQRMKAHLQEEEIRRALGSETRPESGSRTIAEGLRGALRLVGARWTGLNGDRSSAAVNPRPGEEGSVAYGVEPAAA